MPNCDRCRLAKVAPDMLKRGPSRAFPDGTAIINDDGGTQTAVHDVAVGEQTMSGPDNLADLFRWPSEVLRVVLGAECPLGTASPVAPRFTSQSLPVARKRTREKLEEVRTELVPRHLFQKNLEAGLQIRTHYSGLDAPIEALRALIGAAKDLGMDLPDCPVWATHAADIQDRARSMILQIPPDAPHVTPQEHVFGDMLERWPEDVRGVLEEIEDEGRRDFAQSHEDGKAHVVQEMWDVLMDAVEGGCLHDSQSYCWRHKCKCPVLQERHPSECGGMVWAVAGPSCTDFSARGSRQRVLGATTKGAPVMVG